MQRLRAFGLPSALLLALVCACSSMYYGTMEKFGVYKRDILVDRVEEARDAQKEAKEQFRSALAAFRQVAGFEGGELEDLYERLQTEYERSEDRVGDVHERIESIEKVSGDLFDEWKDELGEIKDADLRRKSNAQLDETRERYGELIDSMRRAEKKMQPVLVAFHDHVLFLKHNLNARAIASLQGKLPEIEDDVEALIRDMESSIAEADEFIGNLEAE